MITYAPAPIQSTLITEILQDGRQHQTSKSMSTRGRNFWSDQGNTFARVATGRFAAFPFVKIARPSLGGERTDACPGNGTATSQEAYQDSQRHRYQTLATTTTLSLSLSLGLGFTV